MYVKLHTDEPHPHVDRSGVMLSFQSQQQRNFLSNWEGSFAFYCVDVFGDDFGCVEVLVIVLMC
jgi:hypothetical protein